MGAVGRDGDALPLGAPVLDPVQSHDGFSLSEMVLVRGVDGSGVGGLMLVEVKVVLDVMVMDEMMDVIVMVVLLVVVLTD